jgi:hypothetical protein
MQAFRFVRQRPLGVLGLMGVAFCTWLWWDAGRDLPSAALAVECQAARLRADGPDDAVKTRPTPQVVAQVLPRLKPGMTRTEVEDLLGVPAPEDIHAATVLGGRVTYETVYEADLGARTVRLLHTPKAPGSDPRTVVSLEFDATKPGHPLLDVHYPKPNF